MIRSFFLSFAWCASLFAGSALALHDVPITTESNASGSGGAGGASGPTGISPLPNLLFDFEDKLDRGAYPYDFVLSGSGEIGGPDVNGMTFSGANALILRGGGLTVIEFRIPVEQLEFMWRDQNSSVKTSVAAFDVNGELVLRSESWTDAWLPFTYSDSTRPLERLEFETQSAVYIGVVDDMRVRHRETAQGFCYGDGLLVGCPCANESASGAFEGCMNSSGRGARMHSIGSACTTTRELRFHVTGIPAQRPAILLEGTQDGAAYPFRDGILCLGHLRRRLGVAMSNMEGAATFGQSIFDEKPSPEAGDVYDYQCWFRDPLVSPCGTGSGFSQAQRVWWN